MGEERWEPWWMPEARRVAERETTRKPEEVNVAYGWETDKKETTWSEVGAGCLLLVIQVAFILGLVWAAVKVVRWAWNG